MLVRFGQHQPTLVIMGTARRVVVHFEHFPDTHEQKVLAFANVGVKVAVKGNIGELRTLYFVSEAWMSEAKKGKLPTNPPSADPQRKEVLLINSYSVETKKQVLRMLEMKRNHRGELIELQPMAQPEGGEVESPLLPAFVKGFEMIHRN